MTKAGFIATIGRPNAGKSTLLNTLVNDNIAMVSHKMNATRKRMHVIVMHNDIQLIFVDTPGIHHKEKLLNQFMLNEAMKAIDDCDFIIFIAPASDDLRDYEAFLKLNKKNHLILLSKIDLITHNTLLAKLAQYEQYKEQYKAIIPFSSIKNINITNILDEISKYIPKSPYYYDTEIISTQNLREIYKEKIREAIFDNIHQEIPYQSDVEIKSFSQKNGLDKIEANIIVEKDSQKAILIGKKANTIKNIGICARKKIEEYSQTKLFLKLNVVVKKGWSKDKKILKEIGYNFEI